MSERYLVAGQLRLDLRDERLWVKGTPARLGGRALGLLRELMQQPQLLVTKQELIDRVWNGVAVSDAVLTTAAKEVRQAIGDDARQPSFIQTVHGRGYRFMRHVDRYDIVEATPVAEAAPAGDARRSRRIWPAIVAVVVAATIAVAWLRPPGPAPEPKSLVVVPFRDFSAGGGQRWFADGLAEEIETTLSRTPDLRVSSGSSVANLARDRLSGAEIAARAGAAHFLEGSVRRTDERIRVTAKLVRAADGVELWSQRYDRPPADVISIQEDIAFRIASALKTVLDPAQLRVMVAAGTRSVEAYDAYLQGIALDQRQFREGSLEYALAASDAYERARTLDPGFAAAHWEAARTWFGNATRVDSEIRGQIAPAERQARFDERVAAAIATSRDPVERLKYRAAQASTALELRHAHRLMAQYLAARPRDLEAWEEMADLSAYAGERGWMRRTAERIHALSVEQRDPRSRAITVSVMSLDLDAAVARAREQLELRPDRALTQYQAHRALVWSGRVDEARGLLRRIEASDMPADARLLAGIRQACAEGRTADAAALRAKVEALGEVNSRWQAAQIVGDIAGATALLRPLDRPDQLPTLVQYMINPSFDPRAYPVLTRHLLRAGVEPPRATAMPHACSAARRLSSAPR
jgi:TolB-like protein/DNA-binding winged helix-turn-helix (wHTH) protein